MKRRSFETCCEVARVHLLPAFGGLRLKELNREHVQGLYSRKRDAGLSAARERHVHGVLSSALNHAVRWRLVEHNVCKEVSPPRVPPPEIRPLSLEEAKRFLASAESDRYHALYVLGLTSGMRLENSVSYSSQTLTYRVAFSTYSACSSQATESRPSRLRKPPGAAVASG